MQDRAMLLLKMKINNHVYSDSQNYVPKKTYKRRITQRQIDCHSTGFKI